VFASGFKISLLSTCASIFVLPLCFFFPYHCAFLSLVFFGIAHIFAELNFWTQDSAHGEYPTSFISLVLITASAFSLVALIPILIELFGIPKPDIYANLLLSALAIWFLFFACRYVKRNGILIFVLFFLLGVFIFFAWKRPSLNFFFLVHAHNFLPWLVLLRIIRKKLILVYAAIFSLLLPVIFFGMLTILKYRLSDLALSSALEQEIFKQIVSSEFDSIQATTLLGYFAYQQILHYYLWILIIPIYSKQRPLFRFHKLMSFSSPKSLLSFGAIVTGILLFAIFPVEFRNIYFALGFFHVVMEYPLIFLYPR
jgi:hypothetical protein